MKLLGRAKNETTKDKNDENVPIQKLLKYYQYIEFLVVAIINKIEESCIHFFPINRLINYQIFHPKVWFTDQNSKPLEIEDKINITLVIN